MTERRDDLHVAASDQRGDGLPGRGLGDTAALGEVADHRPRGVGPAPRHRPPLHRAEVLRLVDHDVGEVAVAGCRDVGDLDLDPQPIAGQTDAVVGARDRTLPRGRAVGRAPPRPRRGGPTSSVVHRSAAGPRLLERRDRVRVEQVVRATVAEIDIAGHDPPEHLDGVERRPPATPQHRHAGGVLDGGVEPRPPPLLGWSPARRAVGRPPRLPERGPQRVLGGGCPPVVAGTRPVGADPLQQPTADGRQPPGVDPGRGPLERHPRVRGQRRRRQLDQSAAHGCHGQVPLDLRDLRVGPTPPRRRRGARTR